MKVLLIAVGLLAVFATVGGAADIEVKKVRTHKAGYELEFHVYDDAGKQVGKRRLNFASDMPSTRVKAILRAEAESLLKAPRKCKPADISDIVNKRISIESLPTIKQAAALEK